MKMYEAATLPFPEKNHTSVRRSDFFIRSLEFQLTCGQTEIPS